MKLLQSLSLPKLAILMDKFVQQSQREEMCFWQILREKRYLTRSNPFPAVLWWLTPSTDLSPPPRLIKTVTRGGGRNEGSSMIRTSGTPQLSSQALWRTPRLWQERFGAWSFHKRTHLMHLISFSWIKRITCFHSYYFFQKKYF